MPSARRSTIMPVRSATSAATDGVRRVPRSPGRGRRRRRPVARRGLGGPADRRPCRRVPGLSRRGGAAVRRRCADAAAPGSAGRRRARRPGRCRKGLACGRVVRPRAGIAVGQPDGAPGLQPGDGVDKGGPVGTLVLGGQIQAVDSRGLRGHPLGQLGQRNLQSGPAETAMANARQAYRRRSNGRSSFVPAIAG